MDDTDRLLDDARPWATPCGLHDYGELMAACDCPQGDPRPIVARLVTEVKLLRAEVERLRQEVGRLRATLGEDPLPQGSHVIELRVAGWTLMHPLACRPNLFDCPVSRVAEGGLPATAPLIGRYECALDEAGALVIGDWVGKVRE